MNRFFFLLLILEIVFLSSCKDVFEEDISEDKVNVVAPASAKRFKTREVTFIWNELEGADEYYIEIVTPRYTNIEKIVKDTTIDGTQTSWDFTFPNVGEYEWKIVAKNGGYSSKETIQLIYIDSVNFVNEKVVLISPIDGFRTNDTLILLDWEDFPDAVNYRLEVASPNFGTGTIIASTIEGTSEKEYLFGNEQKYQWKVKAINVDGVESQYSEIWEVDIDFTDPNPPVADSSNVDTTAVTLYWSTNDADIDFDSVFLSKDSLFNTVARTEKVPSVANPFTVFTNLDSTKYFWKVKSIDVAGNISDESNVLSFEIK